MVRSRWRSSLPALLPCCASEGCRNAFVASSSGAAGRDPPSQALQPHHFPGKTWSDPKYCPRAPGQAHQRDGAGVSGRVKGNDPSPRLPSARRRQLRLSPAWHRGDGWGGPIRLMPQPGRDDVRRNLASAEKRFAHTSTAGTHLSPNICRCSPVSMFIPLNFCLLYSNSVSELQWVQKHLVWWEAPERAPLPPPPLSQRSGCLSLWHNPTGIGIGSAGSPGRLHWVGKHLGSRAGAVGNHPSGSNGGSCRYF